MTNRDPLDDELASALRTSAPASTPADVMARVVVARAARQRLVRRVLGGAAAAALLVAAFLARPAPSPAQTPTYVILIHEQLADRLAAPPDERQRRGREFGAWVQGLRARGLLSGGHQLASDGGHLVSTAGVEDRSGGVPAGEVMTGFLLIHADDQNEALRTASECPILMYGGRVALRRLAR